MTLIGAQRTLSNIFPNGIQNSALVLEDGNNVTDTEILPQTNDSCFTPAAINIEHSSDVVIGPVTNFHGPVTIYQNLNGSLSALKDKDSEESNQSGKLTKSESISSDTSRSTESPLKKIFHLKRLKYIAFCLILSILILIIVAVCISFNESPQQQNHQDDDDNNVVIPSGPGAIIEKRIWGGRPALNFTVPLKHPTPLVIISHTATPMCKNFADCAKRMQSIQHYHVGDLHSPDIGYNFLIGGDGNAYVGRGWDIKNFHQPNSIGISFIGNYVYDYLSNDMIDVTKKLLEEGVKNGKLAKDYKIVAHNQTFNTQSPGEHIYEVIRHWPHFDPSNYF